MVRLGYFGLFGSPPAIGGGTYRRAKLKLRYPKWIRKAGGWSLLILGMAACALPVAPGIPLVLAGLVVLAPEYAWARKSLRRLKRSMLQMRQMANAKREAKVAVVRAKSAEES